MSKPTDRKPEDALARRDPRRSRHGAHAAVGAHWGGRHGGRHDRGGYAGRRARPPKPTSTSSGTVRSAHRDCESEARARRRSDRHQARHISTGPAIQNTPPHSRLCCNRPEQRTCKFRRGTDGVILRTRSTTLSSGSRPGTTPSSWLEASFSCGISAPGTSPTI